MFTGIIEETGKVRAIEEIAGGRRLVVRMKKCAKGLKKGDSIAVNGCCLTATRQKRGKTFTVLPARIETRTYTVNYLDVDRQGRSEISVSSSEASLNNSGNGSEGGGGGSSATNQIRTTSQTRFWAELADSLVEN